MSEYVNGFQLNIEEVAKIKFTDKTNSEVNAKLVSEITMTFDCLKMLSHHLSSIIEQHSEKLDYLKKTN